MDLWGWPATGSPATRFGFRPACPGAWRRSTLAWAWATLGMEVLGIAGFLTYGPLLAWTTAGLVIAGVLRWRDRRHGVAGGATAVHGQAKDTGSGKSRRSWRWAW